MCATIIRNERPHPKAPTALHLYSRSQYLRLCRPPRPHRWYIDPRTTSSAPFACVDNELPFPTRISTPSTMTGLLDTPPEIFTRIIRMLVTNVGVNAAWKSRVVCRSFAAYIKDEIFLNRPMSDFDTYKGTIFKHPIYSSPCKLFCHNAGHFILGRLGNPLDVHPDLPKAIKEAANHIAGFESIDFQMDRLEVEVRLCEAAASKRTKSFLWSTLQNGVPFWIKNGCKSPNGNRPAGVTPPDISMADKLVAATLVGNFAAVRACMSEGARLGTHSYVFGYSLTAAATQYDRRDMLPLLLDSLPRSMTQKTAGMRDIHDMFCDAVATLIGHKKYNRAIYLLKFAASRLPAMPKKGYNNLLTDAIAAEEHSIVEAVLQVRIKGTLKVTFNHFDRAIHIGHAPTISVLIRVGNYDVNRVYWGSCALTQAILWWNSIEVVRVLLQNGADPDGPAQLKQLEHQPLIMAMEKQNWDVVKLLLDHGATLEGHHDDAAIPLKVAKERCGPSRCYENVTAGHYTVKARKTYERLEETKQRQDAGAILSTTAMHGGEQLSPFVA
ncbi:hypothetical protein K491DRAFT_347924 [Lophiostoma macrostomum CBS 122681]|uniref:Uncharacterized protein n=1 Tax=Lophiostoma macrostomum CBS 122681 TaxID=1314788 RepID=A0A6A6TEH2_9PLEO|nr:hypothetical protein K491DRAFT_347924 [Lophiostoma macrostomum CBS 122681]